MSRLLDTNLAGATRSRPQAKVRAAMRSTHRLLDAATSPTARTPGMSRSPARRPRPSRPTTRPSSTSRMPPTDCRTFCSQRPGADLPNVREGSKSEGSRLLTVQGDCNWALLLRGCADAQLGGWAPIKASKAWADWKGPGTCRTSQAKSSSSPARRAISDGRSRPCSPKPEPREFSSIAHRKLNRSRTPTRHWRPGARPHEP
jgi:hypothetical protein